MTFAIYSLLVLGSIFYVWREITKELGNIYKMISELNSLYLECYKKLIMLNETTERVLRDEIEKREWF